MSQFAKDVPPGALISFLQKGLQYLGIEENLPFINSEESQPQPQQQQTKLYSLLAPSTVQAMNKANNHSSIEVKLSNMKLKNDVVMQMSANKQQEARASPTSISSTTVNANSSGTLKRGRQSPVTSIATSKKINLGTEDKEGDSSSIALTGTTNMGDTHQQQILVATAMLGIHSQSPVPTKSLNPLSTEVSENLVRTTAYTASPRVVQAKLPQSIPSTKKMAAPPLSAGEAAAAASLLSVNKYAAPATKLESNKNEISTSMEIDQVDNSSTPDESTSTKMNEGPQHLQQSCMNGISSEKLNSESKKFREESTSDKKSDLPQTIDKNGHKSASLPKSESTNGKKSEIDKKEVTIEQENTPSATTADSTSSLPLPDDSQTVVPVNDILTLSKHTSEVFMCAWNPVYKNCVATGSGDATARIWEMAGGRAGDGFDKSILLEHGQVGQPNKDVTTLEWSNTGELLATGSYDGVARVWKKSGELIHMLTCHRGPIFSLKWNKSGTFLLSGSYDKTTIVWEVTAEKGVVRQQFQFHQAPALDVDWKDDTTFASCSTDKCVHICQVGRQEPLKSCKGHTDEVNAVKWDPSGTFLASCSDDCTAKVWNVADNNSNEPLYNFQSHQQEIYTVKWYGLAIIFLDLLTHTYISLFIFTGVQLEKVLRIQQKG